jgi:hypothetical protein
MKPPVAMALMAIDPGRRPSSPPRPINSTREPLRLSLCTLPRSQTLLSPTRTVAPEIRRHAIAGHLALPVAGEHPSVSPHLCSPHVSPARRPDASEPFFPRWTKQPEAHRRRSTAASISATTASPIAQAVSN